MVAPPPLRLHKLTLENIGPFDSAEIEFIADGADLKHPVTLITGENGSGKSILLDAIRGSFGPQYAKLERPIWRPKGNFSVKLVFSDLGDRTRTANPRNRGPDNDFRDTNNPRAEEPELVSQGRPPRWVVDFWRSSLALDPHTIQGLARPTLKNFLYGSLQGTYKNAAVTELICGFDYLRDSRDPRERASGEALYQAMEKIVEKSLLEGKLSHVERKTFTPMIEQSGHIVPLANVSSGNAYLIHHLISMLGKMYALDELREEPPENLLLGSGVLLIDEAENHLHPRWQKVFLKNVLDIFPNLQIIATTHSPFILASIPWARVYVCQYDKAAKTCTVTEETASYENQPVDEILASAAFGETHPFGPEISKLLSDRKLAARNGNDAERARIEQKLEELNPDYFSYFKIDERLAQLKKAAS